MNASGPQAIAVVGGGPAGLSASLAFGRMNRASVVFQAGVPRAARAPCYFNYLGFPDGISGEELLERGRRGARRWGAEIVDAAVTSVKPDDRGFRIETTDGAFRAAGVILATGVIDCQIGCGDLYQEVGGGVHYCVVCDGYETRGERVAVVGEGDKALEMVDALLDFTPDVHLLLDGGEITAAERARLERQGIAVHDAPLRGYACHETGIDLESDDDLERFPHLFIATGVRPRSDVAAGLGCALDDEGYIITDERHATSIPLVYAVGDCDGGQKQVTQAMAEGELAALEMIRDLRERERTAGTDDDGALPR